MSTVNEELSYLDDDARIKAVNAIMAGCQHIYSKGKLQTDKLKPVLDVFAELAEKDPVFLAHFNSYVMTKSESKDLKLITTYANSLSDADGTPFSPKSKYFKPNLRIVAQAALQMKDFDAKQLERIIELAKQKVAFGSKPASSHFSRSLRKGIEKYLKYREKNPKVLEGVVKTGLKNRYKNLYRSIHLAPSEDAAIALKWKQKSWGDEKKEFKNFFDFKGLSDAQIAEKIIKDKLSITGVIGALPKVTPAIALALLEVATPDQAVVLREIFDSQNLFKNKEVLNFYENKVVNAKTALDRVDKINSQIDVETKKVLEKAKSKKRKDTLKEITDVIFKHVDVSGSMNQAIELAKEYGSIIAECINDPKKNLKIGVFNTQGAVLQMPDTFEKEAFQKTFYGIRAGGGTDVMALWGKAREANATVDIFITDCQHNYDSRHLISIINKYATKPRMVVVFGVGDWKRYYANIFEPAFKATGIQAVAVDSALLKESALVAQTIRDILKGKNAIIEDILNTPLLQIPKWWESV